MKPGKTLKQYARSKHMTLPEAYRHARKTGYVLTKKKDKWLPKLQSLPPGLNAREAAQRIGVSEVYVRTLLRQYGYEPARGNYGWNAKIPIKTWKKVNWSMRDCDIARELKVTRERVRQMRLSCGCPRDKYVPVPALDHDEFKKWLEDVENGA